MLKVEYGLILIEPSLQQFHPHCSKVLLLKIIQFVVAHLRTWPSLLFNLRCLDFNVHHLQSPISLASLRYDDSYCLRLSNGCGRKRCLQTDEMKCSPTLFNFIRTISLRYDDSYCFRLSNGCGKKRCLQTDELKCSSTLFNFIRTI